MNDHIAVVKLADDTKDRWEVLVSFFYAKHRSKICVRRLEWY
jgi:hypothetical protein